MTKDRQAILLELLVLRCQRGDKQALDELIRQWQERLLYFVRRLVATEEDAWDVLQQTWLILVRRIRSLDDPHRLPAWLYQIARRTAMSHWRGYYRGQARMEDNVDLAKLAGDDEDNPCDDVEEVHQALSRISLAHREVLTLYFLKDLSLQQMAEVLDIPLGTAKSRLCYAKRALRAVLEQERDNR